jgi:hypothetical protein
VSATADFDASTADSTHQTVGPTAQQTVLEPKLGSTDGDNTPYSTAYSEHSRRKTGVFALLRWARPSGGAPGLSLLDCSPVTRFSTSCLIIRVIDILNTIRIVHSGILSVSYTKRALALPEFA